MDRNHFKIEFQVVGSDRMVEEALERFNDLADWAQIYENRKLEMTITKYLPDGSKAAGLMPGKQGL